MILPVQVYLSEMTARIPRKNYPIFGTLTPDFFSICVDTLAAKFAIR